MKGKNQTQHQLDLERVVGACLMLLLVQSSCIPTPTTPTKPTEAVVVQLADFQVKDDSANAWATLSYVDTFEELNTGTFQDPAINNWQVTTDSDGQAQICPDANINTSTQTCDDVACRIYVYDDSVFGAYPCSESMSGTTGCSLMGTQALANCHMTIDTISASATGLGTWYTLIYLWDTQMTIVIAGEGVVEVTPIETLEFEGEVPAFSQLSQMEPQDRALTARQLVILAREPGASEAISIEEGNPQFYYTAPIAKLEELGLDPELPDREWRPIDQLTLLVQQIRLIEPQLEPWLERIWERAKLDEIPLIPLEGILPGEQLVVTTAGDLWQAPPARDSILYAVDWSVLTEEILGQVMPVGAVHLESTGNLKLISPDAGKFTYDPERAKALFDEGGYTADQQLVLLVPEGNDALEKAADFLVEQMDAAGIKLAIQFQPADELREIRNQLVLTGISVITLNLN